MTKNFIHFLSETPCTISINGKEIGSIDNTINFELDIITQTDKIFVTYTPICNTEIYIPYTFSINTQNSPQTDCEHIKIVPFPNNHYDVIMTPFYYYRLEKSEILLNQNVGKYFISIINDTLTRINIYSGGSIVFSINTLKFKNAKVENKKDYLIIQGIIDNDNYYLLILNTKDFSIVYNDLTQSIESTDEYIQGYKKLNTIPHHAVICKVDFNNDEKDVFYAYENEFPDIPQSKLLLPYSLLESIKIGDIKYISTILSNNLQNTPLDKFKTFFGDIQEIHFNRHLEFTHKLNYTIFNGEYKNYNFVIDGNTISDIEELF